MEIKDGMTVIAPCDGSVTIKKGDEFVVSNVVENDFFGASFLIKASKSEVDRYCLLKECSHIDSQNWIIKPEN